MSLMIYYIYLFLFFVCQVNAYYIYFCRGSFIDKSTYSQFLKQLQKRLPGSTIEYQDYIDWKEFPKDTILIGHSFGGFVSLLHAMNNPENVKACVLVNSHFNHNFQMPYLCMSMHKIKQPVLCIFTDYDEQLPCKKVFQDWDVALKERMVNKQFEMYEGTHFSIFTDMKSTQLIGDRIMKFIEALP